jgi:Mg2+ and Co2+ transporters
MLDFVVDRYAPVIAGLENDIDEIENQVFESDPAVSRRIYELSREVAELQRATKPLLQIVKGLEDGFDKYDTDEELQRMLRDVTDHATSVVERVDGFRANLADILTLNATLVAQTQNEEMRRLAEAGMDQNDEVKKISAWAAILFAPSLISGIYGMNFHQMPELAWPIGYPFAVLLMLVVCSVLFVIFRKRKWL